MPIYRLKTHRRRGETMSNKYSNNPSINPNNNGLVGDNDSLSFNLPRSLTMGQTIGVKVIEAQSNSGAAQSNLIVGSMNSNRMMVADSAEAQANNLESSSEGPLSSQNLQNNNDFTLPGSQTAALSSSLSPSSTSNSLGLPICTQTQILSLHPFTGDPNFTNKNPQICQLPQCSESQIASRTFQNNTCTCAQPDQAINGEQAKLIFGCCVFLLSFVVIITPYILREIHSWFKRKGREKRASLQLQTVEMDINVSQNSEGHDDEMPEWLCYLNAFGAGCFLSVSLLEFMPIVIDRTPEDLGFPLGLFSVGVGFLILALMEHLDIHGICKFVKRCCGKHNEGKNGNHSGSSNSQQNMPLKAESMEAQYSSGNTKSTPVDSSNNGIGSNSNDNNNNNSELELGNGLSSAEKNDSHNSLITPGARRCLKLTLAFLPHSFMVGMAVGMGSSWAIIKGILIGIIPHKVIVLSSLGAQYIHSRLPFPFAATLAFVFAMVMPSGTLSGHLFIHSLGVWGVE